MDLAELFQERQNRPTNKSYTIIGDFISAIITLSFFFLMIIFLVSTARK